MDPIANLLTVIRNGYMARKKTISVPYSKLKEEILKILTKERYISSSKLKEKELEITLKYENDKPALLGIRRVSKPGLRIYRGAKKIPKVLSSYGITIVSTSKGVMTDKEAKKMKLGGEIICQVW